jgi:hypothetical protein
MAVLMTAKDPKRPRDANQLCKLIVDLATDERTEELLTPAQVFARASGTAGLARVFNTGPVVSRAAPTGAPQPLRNKPSLLAA